MQRIITEEQIPTGDFREVKYVGAIKNRLDDGTSVPVWTVSNRPLPQPVEGQPPVIDDWKDILIDVEDPEAPDTAKRLHAAIEARRKQQQID